MSNVRDAEFFMDTPPTEPPPDDFEFVPPSEQFEPPAQAANKPYGNRNQSSQRPSYQHAGPRKFEKKTFQSSQQLVRQQPAKLSEMPEIQYDERGGWAMTNRDQEMALIARLRGSGALPEGFKNDLQIAFAIQALKAADLNIFASIGHVSFIHGQYTEFDDVPLAKVIRSGQMQFMDEWGFVLGEDGKYVRMDFANNNLHLPAAGAICEVQRVGQPKKQFAFTQRQAQKASLSNKKGAWSTDDLVMMKRKARTRAFNTVFPDIILFNHRSNAS